jgi:hypothetical protein
MNVSTKAKNRMTLMLVMGIPLLLTAISTWLWVFVVKGDIDLVGMLGTHNHGNLINPPVQIDEYKKSTVNGEEYRFESQDKKWAFINNVSAPCEETCKESLYISRQARSALGKEMSRIRIYAVASSAEEYAAIDQLLTEQHPDIIRLVIDNELLKSMPQKTNNTEPVLNMQRRDDFYVVDPNGWLMMQYTEQHTGRQMLDDMKFLLKNSSVE